MVLLLGKIKPSRASLRRINPQVDTGGLAGVGEALSQLGQTFEGLSKKLKAREEKTNRFNALKGLTDLRSGLENDILEMNRAKELGAPGHTDSVERLLTERFNEYIEGVDERLREEMTFRFNVTRRALLSAALADQLESEDLLFTTQFAVLRERSFTSVFQDSSKLDVERAILFELIESSSIPEEDKAVLLTETDIALRKAVFSGELENDFAVGGNEPAVAAAEIPDQGAAFLNVIAGPESGGRYNVRNDGTDTGAIFNDFSQHPNVPVTLPDGTITTAAGRYQFTFETWEEVRRKLGLSDFGPESQDRAAWFLAQERYKENINRNLITDLREGDDATLRNIREVLIPTWQGLNAIGSGAFASHFSAMATAAALPEAMNDPRFTQGPGAIPFVERERLAARAKRIGEARRREAQIAYLGGVSGRDFQNDIDFMRRTGEETPGSRFSDSRIIEMFDPAEAAELMAKRDRALSDGVIFNVVRSSTVGEDVATLEGLRAVMTTPNGEAANRETFDTTLRLVKEKQEALDKDPAAWVLGTNGSILALLEGIANVGNTQAATTMYDEAMAAEQVRLGVAPSNTRILTDDQADAVVEGIINPDVAFEAQGPLLRQQLEERGDRGQQLLEELVEAGLPDLLFHAAIVDKASVWTRVAALLDPNNDPAKLLSSGQLSEIKETVADNFNPFVAAFGAGDFLGEANERTVSMLAVAEKLVQQLVVQGASEEEAARSVYEELITDQYNILEAGVLGFGRVEALLPRAIKVDGAFVEIDPDQVSIAAEFLLTTDRLGEDELPAIETLNLARIFFEGDVTQDMEATRQHITDSATWYLGTDSLGLVLMVPTSESSPTGDPVPVLRELTEEEKVKFPGSPGLPVTRSLIELQNMSVAPPSGPISSVVGAVSEIEEAVRGRVEGLETPTLREIREGALDVPGFIERDVRRLLE